jgi:hypothetical protein
MGPVHLDTLVARNNLANLQRMEGRYDEAKANYLLALEVSAGGNE